MRGEGAAEGPEDLASNGVSTGFCVLLALLMIVLRLQLFESCLFRPTCVPNHDMSQGLTFFGTSIQNLRLTGDIAWWNPISREGYAQYFQSFLSPLAPTPHHVTFVVWGYAVRLLAWLHVRTPSEYIQYVVFNYLLLPFLTYWALGDLARGLFRHWGAVFLVVVTFALSSIGLWNAAWFYFQESFTLFFLLGSFVHAVQRPGRTQLALLAAAILVQASSLNYWSIYNVLFILLFTGTYLSFHVAAARRLLANAARLLRNDRAAQGVSVLVVGTAIAWMSLTASIAREQTGSYLRTTAPESLTARTKGVRTFTVELWNPGIELAIENYPAKYQLGNEPPIHNARYLGVALLPLLALVPFVRWRRRTAWLIPLALELFVMCLAPHFLADPISRIPYLNQIQHLFYFYTAHFQLSMVLVAAGAWDGAFAELNSTVRMRLLRASGGVLAMAVVVAGAAWSLRHFLPGVHEHPGYYIRAFGLAVSASILMRALLAVRAMPARIGFAALFLSMHAVDLSAYFAHGSRIDQSFTAHYWQLNEPLDPSFAKHLLELMPEPDPKLGPTAGLERGLGFHDHFWPANEFMIPATHLDFHRHPEAAAGVQRARPLDFFPQGERPESEPLVLSHESDVGDSHFNWRWLHWGYNAIAFSLTVPAEGWLFLLQTYDPLWRFSVDGRPCAARASNFIGTALRLPPGAHQVRASYRPLARRLYGPASAALIMTLLLLLSTCFSRRREA